MPVNQIIDVHCHLFNAQYAIMELASATWNMLRGNYPHRGSAKKRRRGVRDVRGLVKTIEGVKDFAAYIARLVEAALSDCPDSYAIAQKNFSESDLRDCSLLMAPLMMDIYFALDNNKDEEVTGTERRRAPSTPEIFAISDNEREEFSNHFDLIASLIRDEIETIPETTRRSSADYLNKIIESARGELLAPSGKARRGDEYDGIELSPGYRKHMKALEDLSANNPNTVFPFLAIDPRRIGIMKLIEMKVNKGTGVFKGIKLYPPLGYLPTHPNFQPVFEYCEKHDIPVTIHYSDGGMQNFRKENYIVDWEGNNHPENFESTGGIKSRYYTSPDKWMPVMKEYPNLRINFAHFGGGGNFTQDFTEWMKGIENILKEHDKAYTDISYFTQEGLCAKVSDMVEHNELLAKRLMFGTDYVMIMMDRELGGLKACFNSFTGLKDELLFNNARDFLKI